MTILDACVDVLRNSNEPMKSAEIYQAIEEAGTYKFGAKDPLAIVRGTLRKHLRAGGPHRIQERSKDQYQAS